MRVIQRNGDLTGVLFNEKPISKEEKHGTIPVREVSEMQYSRIREAVFTDRPNRFVANITIGGIPGVGHVKNTGRCRELLIPGATVYLEESSSKKRKTAYDLIAVKKGDRLINMDSQAPNRVFAEWVPVFEPECTGIRPEYRTGQSRLDFLLETPAGPHFVEVKGVTLEEDGHTRFPDAPTERGVKHLMEFIRLAEEGYRATAFFVIQMDNVTDFSPNDRTHPEFGSALRMALARGVEILAYSCQVRPDYIVIDKQIPVIL